MIILPGMVSSYRSSMPGIIISPEMIIRRSNADQLGWWQKKR
ncbi:hypothetical protein [Rufibacter immobilis]